MMFKINGVDAGLEVATFSEIGFGLLSRDGFVSYCLELEEHEFIAKIGPGYRKAVEELEFDDLIVGEFQAPFPGACGYPSLEELLSLREDYRMPFIEVTIQSDILNCFWREGSDSPSTLWILQSLDSISLVNRMVRMAGIAVPVPALAFSLSPGEAGPKENE